MTNHLFSKQDVIKLLSQLRNIRAEYPPELLATRRRIYLSLAAQLAATRNTIDSRRKQVVSAMVQESTIIKVLLAILVAFLIAFGAYSITTGNVNFGWLMELLSR